MEMGKPLRGAFAKTLLDQIVEVDRKIVYVGFGDSVIESLSVLSENKILSAPVADIKGRWLGFVDLIAILKFAYKKQGRDDVDLEVWREIMHAEMSQVLRTATGDSLIFCTKESSLLQILPFFGGGVAHRCLVAVSDPKVNVLYNAYKIVSQIDVIVAMYDMVKNMSSKDNLLSPSEIGVIASILSRAVSETMLPMCKKMATMTDTKTVLDAVSTLMRTGVSCLGILDLEGKLCANFSSSDLKGLRFLDDEFFLFKRNVIEFLFSYSPLSLKPVTISPETTLETMLELVVTKKIHRIWVVSADGKPSHVITLTDILQFINSLT
jgi:CBS domain-containing protein